jgi:DNA-binding ferritin-like protein (Dps family)
MAMGWIEQVTGSLEQKKQYKQYKARTKQLPANYRTAIDALERYLTYFGAITKGETLVKMLEDLADLFEQSAAGGTPIREIVGDDPVEFAETFLQNYSEGQWMNKERKRLNESIASVMPKRFLTFRRFMPNASSPGEDLPRCTLSQPRCRAQEVDKESNEGAAEDQRQRWHKRYRTHIRPDVNADEHQENRCQHVSESQ